MAAQQPQLDVDIGTRAAREHFSGAETPFEPAPSGALPVDNAQQARGQEFASTQQGDEQLGEAAQQTAQSQIDAQHATWLMNTGNQFKLEAQQNLQDSVRNLQPGQSVADTVQNNLNQLQQKYAANIQSPELQKAFALHSGSTVDAVMGQAQAYDFQERDRYAVFNYNQGMNSALRSVTMATNYDDAMNSSRQSLGQSLATVDQMHLMPAEKDKLKLDTIAQFGDAQARTQQRLDPNRWLADHYAALTPEGRAQQADQGNLPRGLRNNNPGNLTGDDQWQGLVGKDAGGYLKFDTPENGLRALNIDLMNQQDKHGLNTVQDIIGKYAPPDSNNTPAYVAAVSKDLNVQPDQPLDMHDDNLRHNFADAIIKHENGGGMPFHPESTAWATLDVAGKATSPAPTADRPDGTTRNADPVWNMQTYEGQQKLLSDYMQVQRQMRSLSADDRRAFATNYSQFKQDVQKGIPLSDADAQSLSDLAQKANEPSMVAQAQQLLALNDTTRSLTRMNPGQVTQFISDLQAQPESDVRANRLALAEKFQTTQAEQIKNNPISYFARQGNQIPPLDFTKPQSFAARAVIARTLVENYGAKPESAYFTPEEANQVVSSFNDAPPAAQRVMAKNFADGFGNDTSRAASIFQKTNPNFSYAASMLSANPDSSPNANMVNTAMDMIAGDKRLRTEPVEKLIPRQQVDQVMSSNGWNKILPPDGYDRMVRAVQAVYAGRHPEQYKLDSNLGSDIEQAAEDASGGQRAQAGNMQVVTPPGVDKDTFEAFTNKITAPQIRAGLASGRQYLTGESGIDPNKLQFPQSNRGIFEPGKSNFNLRTVGPGLYEMIGDDGKPYLSPDTPGGYALLRFNSSDVAAPPKAK